MKLFIKKGTTNKSIDIFVQDSSKTDGSGLTGLVYNSSGLVCYYHRPGSAAAALTLATQTVTGSHSDGGFVEISSANMPGVYRLDLSDAILASGVDQVTVMLKGASNMAPVPIEIQLTGIDVNDATSGGISRIDANVSSRSSHSAADVWTSGTRSLTDKAGFSLSSAGNNAVRDVILSDSTAFPGANINAAISSRSSHSAADVWTSVTRSLTDKDGFTLSASGNNAVRDVILSDSTAFPGANINASISSRSSHSAADVWTSGTRSLTDKDGFTLSAAGNNAVRDVILSDSTPFPGANIDAAITTRATPTQVKTQADQALVDYDSSNGVAKETSVQSIQNNTRFNCVPASPILIKETGNNIFPVTVQLQDSDGNPEDPDIQETVPLLAVLSRAINGGSDKTAWFDDEAGSTPATASSTYGGNYDRMVKVSTGQFILYYKLPDTETPDVWKLTFKYKENGVEFVKERQFTVADSNPATVVLASTGVDGNTNKDVVAGALKERDVSGISDVSGSIYQDIAGSGYTPASDNLQAIQSAISGVQTTADNIETDTQDIQSKLGTPPNLGSGATVGDNLEDIAGSGFTAADDLRSIGTTVRANGETADEIYNDTKIAVYQGGVWLDSGSGNTGQIIGDDGTPDNPVNNWTDAVALAGDTKTGFHKIFVISAPTLDVNLDVMEIIGINNNNSVINFTGGTYSCDSAVFRNITVTGTPDNVAQAIFYNCKVNGLKGIEDATFYDCYLVGSFQFRNDSASAAFHNCFDNVGQGVGFDVNSPSVNCELTFSYCRFSEGAIENINGNCTVVISGIGNLDLNSPSGGEITVLGNWDVINTGTADVKTSFNIDPVQNYQGAVWLKSGGASGTTVGFHGVPDNPSGNWADALTLARAGKTGLNRICVVGNAPSLTQDIDNVEIYGITQSSFVDFSTNPGNYDAANTRFSDIAVSGKLGSGGSEEMFIRCNADGINGFQDTRWIDCVLFGQFTPLSGGKGIFSHCWDDQASGLSYNFNNPGSGTEVEFQGCNFSHIDITNANANCSVRLIGGSGEIDLNNVSTAMTVVVSGNWRILNKGSATITDLANITAIQGKTPGADTFDRTTDALEAIEETVSGSLNGYDKYNGAVWLINGGSSGQVVGTNGTADNPVGNWTDAKALAGSSKTGFSRINVIGTVIPVVDVSLSDLLITGIGTRSPINVNSQVIQNCVFVNIWVSGIYGATSWRNKYVNCFFNGLEEMNDDIAYDSEINIAKVKDGSTNRFVHCHGEGTLSFENATLSTTVYLEDFSTDVLLIDNSNSNCNVKATGRGTLNLDSGASNVYLAGHFKTINDSSANVNHVSNIGDNAADDSVFEKLAELNTYASRVDGLIEDSSGDRFTEKALEEAPTGGDATEAKQDSILEDIVDMKGTGFAKDTDSLVNLSHKAGTKGTDDIHDTMALNSTVAKDATVSKATGTKGTDNIHDDLATLSGVVALESTLITLAGVVALDSTVAKESTLSALAGVVALDSTVAKESTLSGVDTKVANVQTRIPSALQDDRMKSNVDAIGGSATIDGVALTAWTELVLAMVNGRFKKDTPTTGQVTFYKRDNTTPLTIVNVTDTERTRVS